MQYVVTRQAPINLERKITSGAKQIKQKIEYITETNRIIELSIYSSSTWYEFDRPTEFGT